MIMHTKFQTQNLKGKANLIDLGVVVEIILKFILKIYLTMWIGFNWLHIVFQWRAIVNIAMNLRVP